MPKGKRRGRTCLLICLEQREHMLVEGGVVKCTDALASAGASDDLERRVAAAGRRRVSGCSCRCGRHVVGGRGPKGRHGGGDAGEHGGDAARRVQVQMLEAGRLVLEELISGEIGGEIGGRSWEILEARRFVLEELPTSTQNQSESIRTNQKQSDCPRAAAAGHEPSEGERGGQGRRRRRRRPREGEEGGEAEGGSGWEAAPAAGGSPCSINQMQPDALRRIQKDSPAAGGSRG